MADIKFVIFDLNDVLYDADPEIRLELLEDLTGRPAAEIDAAVWGGPHEEEAEAGNPGTSEGYLAQFAGLLGYPIDFETWAEIHRRMLRPRPDVFEPGPRNRQTGRHSDADEQRDAAEGRPAGLRARDNRDIRRQRACLGGVQGPQA
ncbi:hypothetical protein QW131_01630 [Roseibium salinum]|nr:hypothetical protein [Roseibium salinum]